MLPTLLLSLAAATAQAEHATEADRPRPREAGVVIGILPPGEANAITDVDGVRVGHATVREGDGIRTGVTVVLPHGGNPYREKVPAAVWVGNGFGKAVGFTQVRELGEIETPIALTNTLSTFAVADALVEWMLGLEGNEGVRSVNPVVGETNDGRLNDIRARVVGGDHLRAALRAADAGPVAEGAVGAGTGTVAFGFKGGIGTASRRLPGSLGGWTVGVLVQSNFGGVLEIAGAPVGRELGRYSYSDHVEDGDADGSCMIVLATDAPLGARDLERLAKRTFLAFGRVGAFSSNGSGDYAIAFSTAPRLRRRPGDGPVRTVPRLVSSATSPLFLAAVEATTEAMIASLFAAETTTGVDGRTVEALPLDRTLEILRRHRLLRVGDDGPD